MTRQEQFAAALGVEPDDIKPDDFDALEYCGEQADGEGHWTLTDSDTIRVEFGCLRMDTDVLHSISATVSALNAANKAFDAAIAVAVRKESA